MNLPFMAPRGAVPIQGSLQRPVTTHHDQLHLSGHGPASCSWRDHSGPWTDSDRSLGPEVGSSQPQRRAASASGITSSCVFVFNCTSRLGLCLAFVARLRIRVIVGWAVERVAHGSAFPFTHHVHLERHMVITQDDRFVLPTQTDGHILRSCLDLPLVVVVARRLLL